MDIAGGAIGFAACVGSVCRSHKLVMPGLVPGIHGSGAAETIVDGRDKPGHDDVEASGRNRSNEMCESSVRKREKEPAAFVAGDQA